MLPGLEMIMSCPNLAVPAEVMRHVAGVESGANPFAIGVVGGRLVRQPANLDEAVATANMLEASGYNYSLGLAQVNRVNFSKYGFDTPAKAFDVCNNLTAGANILADCYRDAGNDWGKAFSCYYSGNFSTGFAHGYVQKIYNSILGSAQAAEAGPRLAAAAIPIMPEAKPSPVIQPKLPASGRQLITLRSVPIHAPANAGAPAMTATPASAPGGNDAMTVTARRAPAPVRATAGPNIFVPQVRGPHDPVPAPEVTVVTPASQSSQARDSAFVF
jgi:type IV secretion system protein VirB1